MTVEFKDIQLRHLAGDDALVTIQAATESAKETAANEEGRLPDIVVYLADDLSAADLKLYGGTNIETPAINQLAAEGMTFNRAFVASPSCAVSRAAMLTVKIRFR